MVIVPMVNMPLPIAFNEAPFAADKMANGEDPDADIWTCDKH
jgi:hypothetical protein